MAKFIGASFPISNVSEGDDFYNTSDKQTYVFLGGNPSILVNWKVEDDTQNDALESRISTLENRPYGNMYAYEVAVSVTVAQSGVWYEVTSGLTGGEEHLCTFQNSHEIKVSESGKYKIDWSMALTTSTAQDEIMGTIGINGTANTRAANHGTVVKANGFVAISGNTILDLKSDDVLSMFVLQETAARNITIEHITLSMTKVG